LQQSALSGFSKFFFFRTNNIINTSPDVSNNYDKNCHASTQNLISSFECTEKKIFYPLKTKSTENIFREMILEELWQILTKESDCLFERVFFERKVRFLTKELIRLNQNLIKELYQLELLNKQLIHENLNHQWKKLNNQRIQLILTIRHTISKRE
jgi:hypothetical protein